MATFTPKKNKVTGTKKKDKIVWQNKKEWKKNLTVDAGLNADTIDFSKSSKTNTFIGGKGNDTIKTGTGTSTVVINKGDGNDTIYNNGKKMIIKMGSPNSKDKTSWQKKGNDLIMNYIHALTKSDKKKQVKEVVTIKNYFKNDGTIANKNIYLKNTQNKKVSDLFESKGLAIVPAGKTYKGSYLNDKITGSSGNDTIYGYDGIDVINGGAGNDFINAGKGKNIIHHYHVQGDGTDTIINGGGEDTLILDEAADFEYLSGYASGDNVVLSYEYGDSIVLQDYLKGGHSLKWVKIGNKTVRTEEIRNKFSSGYSDTVINGTRWGDEINVYSVMEPTLNSGDGDDIINILTSWNVDITTGKGDDIIDVSGYNTYNLDIKLENNSGNDRLTGILPNISSDSHISFYGASIVSQTQDGNNLILNLESGNTFTIENYYSLSDNEKNRLFDENIGNTVPQLLSGKSLSAINYNSLSLKSEIASWQSAGSMSNNAAAEFISENINNYDICQMYYSS